MVIANGDFHSSGHFACAVNEGFHDSKFGWSKMLLHRDKVPKHIESFEADSYKHCTTLIKQDLCGTLAYFLLDVTNPPPSLLLDDPAAYEAQLESAGGIAAFKSILYGSNPAAMYQHAARACDGALVTQLQAFSLHAVRFLSLTLSLARFESHPNQRALPRMWQCRAWAHKPVEARVLLLALLSTEATHPKIAEIVRATNSLPLSDLPGCAMFADRVVEYLNWLQDQRRGTYSAFDHALEFTEAMAGMMHVAYTASGEKKFGDTLTQADINAAKVIRESLKLRLGTDLTVACTSNGSYHTGGGGDMFRSTAIASQRPWDFIEGVALGTRTGPGKTRPEHWATYTERHLNLPSFFTKHSM